ncbi:hypothetical protein EYF80_004278 [Liparis tanakae]|uniref:Uncharacterized protein n=1 Tax=Liparis tanakae TaxID=230148 RepID=A0A4Z2J5H4_9TELE|nr:hypothetical protein EYF80_004278 [Liparis tanakae]
MERLTLAEVAMQIWRARASCWKASMPVSPCSMAIMVFLLGEALTSDSQLAAQPAVETAYLGSYLNGDITVGASDDPRDSQRDVIMDGIGAIGACVLTVVHFREGGPDKLQRLLQSVGVLRASVQYMSSQFDPRQDAFVVVDFIECQQHGLQSLDPSLSIDLPTVLYSLTLLVHREQAANHQISFQCDLPLGVSVIPYHRQPLGRLGKERHTQAHQAEVERVRRKRKTDQGERASLTMHGSGPMAFLIQERKACQPLTHFKPDWVKEWEEWLPAAKKKKKR